MSVLGWVGGKGKGVGSLFTTSKNRSRLRSNLAHIRRMSVGNLAKARIGEAAPRSGGTS